jgi:hypothetical protein
MPDRGTRVDHLYMHMHTWYAVADSTMGARYSGVLLRPAFVRLILRPVRPADSTMHFASSRCFGSPSHLSHSAAGATCESLYLLLLARFFVGKQPQIADASSAGGLAPVCGW